MASGRRQPVAEGGFWSTPQAPVSKETQQLLKVMMEESKLTNFQRRQLQKTMDNGKPLPLNCNPTSSRPGQPPKMEKTAPQLPSVMNAKHLQGGKRTKEDIDENEKKHPREVYRPPPRKFISEKDKRKLQNVMAYGELGAHLEDTPRVKPERKIEPEPEVDRFDELLHEIEERRAFITDMEKLGKGKEYRTIIDTEISQKIRELEVIDKKRSKDLELAIKEDTRLKEQEKKKENEAQSSQT